MLLFKKFLGILLVVLAVLAGLGAGLSPPQLLRGGAGNAAYNSGSKLGELVFLMLIIGSGGGLFLLGRHLVRLVAGQPPVD